MKIQRGCIVMQSFRHLTLVLTIISSSAFAEEATQSNFLDELNKDLMIRQGVIDDAFAVPPRNDLRNPVLNSESLLDILTSGTFRVPDYGIILFDEQGDPIRSFGAVPYTIDDEGSIFVAGYRQPEGSTFEIVSQQEWIEVTASIADQALKQMMKPIEMLPEIVTYATDFLAERLCGNPSRPSSITLILMVNASGGVVFLTAGTESGSEVSWDFADVCVRQGRE